MSILDEESISNEAKLYEIANLIDNDFFTESIKEQIHSGLDGITTNYLDELNVKIENIKENYDESDYRDAVIFQEELHRNIIEWIRDKYDINIDYDEENLLPIAKNLYIFFVIDLKEVMISFLTHYLQENYKTVIRSIDISKFNTSQLNPNISKDNQLELLLLTNIGVIIDEVVGMDISFDEFIKYASRSGDILSVSEIANGNHVLAVSGSEGIVQELMKEIRNNIYDHTMTSDIIDLLSATLDVTIPEKMYENNID